MSTFSQPHPPKVFGVNISSPVLPATINTVPSTSLIHRPGMVLVADAHHHPLAENLKDELKLYLE